MFPHLFTPHYVSWFLFGPLLYLYLRFALDSRYRPQRRFYWAFLPALLSFANYYGLYALDTATKVQMFRDSVIHASPDALTVFVPLIPRDLVFAGQLVFLTGFLLVSVRLLHRAGNNPYSAGNVTQKRNLHWLTFVLVSFTVAALISNFYFRAIWLSSLIPIE